MDNDQGVTSRFLRLQVSQLIIDFGQFVAGRAVGESEERGRGRTIRALDALPQVFGRLRLVDILVGCPKQQVAHSIFRLRFK